MESTLLRYRTPNYGAEPMGWRWFGQGVVLALAGAGTYGSGMRVGRQHALNGNRRQLQTHCGHPSRIFVSRVCRGS
jgi:hypothetical protein